jgi:hypothetical protein
MADLPERDAAFPLDMLLGQRFMRREVYSKTEIKIRTKRVSTGVSRYRKALGLALRLCVIPG